jgi:Xaa-Pro aminopeptidase
MRKITMSPKDQNTAENILKLIKKVGFQGLIVPQADEFQGEYISENNMRLRWLTGFSGSAGTAVLFDDQIHLFVDGRYTIQAAQQVDANVVTIHHYRDPTPAEWLADQVKPGMCIGYDPRLHSISNIKTLKKMLKEKKAKCIATEKNPIDSLWSDRPDPPFTPVHHHDLAYTGCSSNDKIEAIAKELEYCGADAIVLNEMDAIAWTFNIRGGDTTYTPLMQGFAIISSDAKAQLFANPDKFSENAKASLGSRTTLHDTTTFPSSLDELGKAQLNVSLDKNSSTDWTHERLKKAGVKIIYSPDPTKLQRARKNKTEISGAHAAHNRDAIAVIRFLRWLDETVPATSITELDVVAKIHAFRAEGDLFKGLSFPTIAGAGPHGAIVHYIPTKQSNRELEQGSLLLLDSGGQYLDGTTDITRTLPIGKPDEEMRRHFTLVLKGHIAIASAHFPIGTSGGQLDALARQHLWRANLNYDHGTGHGVGSYLGVHEGPHRLASGSIVPFEVGMIISNEPGHYLKDQYGIRIENLLVVVESEAAGFLEFAPLTLAPIDRRLIEINQLSNQELDWLNSYHQKVLDNAADKLDEKTFTWLATMCAPLYCAY